MKKTDLFRIRGFLLITMLICGCGKTLLHSGFSPLIKAPSGGNSYYTNDPKLSPFYGDSLLYMRSNEPSGYLIAPLNDLGLGTYISWPAGLSINASTGVIDLSGTEPGARYNIGFVNTLTRDTAFRQLTIAGVGYLDGIYDMSSGDSLLTPYFNANPAMTSIGDVSHGKIKAIFDWEPLFPRTDEPHLKVNTGTGVIDLKNSVLQGVFGANPQNGATREMTVYYKLDDQSNMSLQKTSVILHYYHSLSDVPASLINSIQAARASFLGSQVINNQIIAESQPSTVMTYSSTAQPVTANSSDGSSQGFGSTKASGGSGGPGQATNPRPPHLCIVNMGH
jgi:hypothetical protein